MNNKQDSLKIKFRGVVDVNGVEVDLGVFDSLYVCRVALDNYGYDEVKNGVWDSSVKVKRRFDIMLLNDIVSIDSLSNGQKNQLVDQLSYFKLCSVAHDFDEYCGQIKEFSEENQHDKIKENFQVSGILEKISPFLNKKHLKLFDPKNKIYSNVLQRQLFMPMKIKNIITVLHNCYTYAVYKLKAYLNGRSLIWDEIRFNAFRDLHNFTKYQYFKFRIWDFFATIGLTYRKIDVCTYVGQVYDKNDPEKYSKFANVLSRSLSELNPIRFLMEPSSMELALDRELFIAYLFFDDLPYNENYELTLKKSPEYYFGIFDADNGNIPKTIL